jgi:hypothetical protein
VGGPPTPSRLPKARIFAGLQDDLGLDVTPIPPENRATDLTIGVMEILKKNVTGAILVVDHTKTVHDCIREAADVASAVKMYRLALDRACGKVTEHFAHNNHRNLPDIEQFTGTLGSLLHGRLKLEVLFDQRSSAQKYRSLVPAERGAGTLQGSVVVTMPSPVGSSLRNDFAQEMRAWLTGSGKKQEFDRELEDILPHLRSLARQSLIDFPVLNGDADQAVFSTVLGATGVVGIVGSDTDFLATTALASALRLDRSAVLEVEPFKRVENAGGFDLSSTVVAAAGASTALRRPVTRSCTSSQAVAMVITTKQWFQFELNPATLPPEKPAELARRQARFYAAYATSLSDPAHDEESTAAEAAAAFQRGICADNNEPAEPDLFMARAFLYPLGCGSAEKFCDDSDE